MRKIRRDENSHFRLKIAIVNFNYSPDDLTDFLKIEPTKIHLKGIKSSAGVESKINGWFYEPKTKKLDVNSRLDLIFKKKKFFELKSSKFNKCEIVIQCMLDLDGNSDPIISLSEKSIAQLAKLGASFDLDYYKAAKSYNK